MSAALSFDQLKALAPRFGVTDAACPLCSGQVSVQGARRKVLRVWRERDEFAGFACARCGEKGWARDRASSRSQKDRLSPERLAAIRREAAEREERTAAEWAGSLHRARWLWSLRRAIENSPAEKYLRKGRGYQGPLPATLAYLPAGGEHDHALIAAFGIAYEPEDEDFEKPPPPPLAITDDAVVGVHITRLNADGSGKAEQTSDNANKKIHGRGSVGFPICIAPPNDLLGLAVTEGIEEALSVHQATGLGAWAAGCAARMPALARAVPSYIECVTVCADPEPTGQKNARALAEALTERGIEILVRGLKT